MKLNTSSRHNITTPAPEQVKSGADEVLEWIAKEKIAYLAIHIDLDVLTHLCSAPFFCKTGGAENTILATLLKAN